MEKINLKNSELNVSRLCFGGCPMGQYGWGNVPKEDLINAVNQAVDAGVNFFDTADTYGLGEAERTLSEALGKKRKDVVIATKFGVRIENSKTFYDNSPEWIVQACENSLKRLRTDYIDIYQIHYRDNITPIKTVVETLRSLKKEGKIRYFGLSNISEDDMEELLPFKNEFICFQNEYSLACRKHEDTMKKVSEELCSTPLTWGSLGQGILTGKYTDKVSFSSDDRRSREIYVNFHGEKLIKNLEIVAEMKKISEKINKPLSAIAIRWILDYLKGSVVIAGIKNPSQLENNVAALGWNLDNSYIDKLNLISQ